MRRWNFFALLTCLNSYFIIQRYTNPTLKLSLWITETINGLKLVNLINLKCEV